MCLAHSQMAGLLSLGRIDLVQPPNGFLCNFIPVYIILKQVDAGQTRQNKFVKIFFSLNCFSFIFLPIVETA